MDGHVPEDPTVGADDRVVAAQVDPVGSDRMHPLEQLAVRRARVASERQLTGARAAGDGHQQQPVTGA